MLQPRTPVFDRHKEEVIKTLEILYIIYITLLHICYYLYIFLNKYLQFFLFHWQCLACWLCVSSHVWIENENMERYVYFLILCNEHGWIVCLTTGWFTNDNSGPCCNDWSQASIHTHNVSSTLQKFIFKVNTFISKNRISHKWST